MGDRFRMIVNTVDVIEPEAPCRSCRWRGLCGVRSQPVGWRGLDHAGGAHHTVFSQALNAEHIYDFSEMAGIEYLQIDQSTELRSFKNELRWNDLAYKLGS